MPLRAQFGVAADSVRDSLRPAAAMHWIAPSEKYNGTTNREKLSGGSDILFEVLPARFRSL